MKNNIKRLAFSLVELMISLITISLITAAFAPVITKKLSAGTITVGSFEGGSETSGGGACNVANCNVTDNECNCIQCTPGYGITSGACLLCTGNTYSINGTASCQTAEEVPGCGEYDNITGECIACASGEYDAINKNCNCSFSYKYTSTSGENVTNNSEYIEETISNGITLFTFKQSGIFEIVSGQLSSGLAFAVGGGGSGSSSGWGGGGGGYTNTGITQNFLPGKYFVSIGEGGHLTLGSGIGGFTNIADAYANGGCKGTSSSGGNGGSGGAPDAGTPASDGNNAPNSSYGAGGLGQGSTTRAFGVSSGTLFAGGGAPGGGSNYTTNGGAGGGGATRQNGVSNTGGGGGMNGLGGSGVALLRGIKSTGECAILNNFKYKYTTSAGEDVTNDPNYIRAMVTSKKVFFVFLKSGIFIISQGAIKTASIFAVGGGGGGCTSWGGGGGGYTETISSQVLSSGTYNISIGQGGSPCNNGESTSFGDIISAMGGNGGTSSSGGNGGSGGAPDAGTPASDGNNAPNSSYGAGGLGQGSTTRAFGVSSGTLFAGGGAPGGGSNYTRSGGSGGGGSTYYPGGENTGGGGGARAAGGSGIILLKGEL